MTGPTSTVTSVARQPYRVIVTGSPTWTDQPAVHCALGRSWTDAWAVGRHLVVLQLQSQRRRPYRGAVGEGHDGSRRPGSLRCSALRTERRLHGRAVQHRSPPPRRSR